MITPHLIPHPYVDLVFPAGNRLTKCWPAMVGVASSKKK